MIKLDYVLYSLKKAPDTWSTKMIPYFDQPQIHYVNNFPSLWKAS